MTTNKPVRKTTRPTPERYLKLKELLEAQETFPLDYIVKFIGKNTPLFASEVAGLESARPELKRQSRRESGQTASHVAFTYTLAAAPDADAIIDVLIDVSMLQDVLVVL